MKLRVSEAPKERVHAVHTLPEFWFDGIPVTLHSKEFPSSQLAQSHLRTWITLKWETAMGEGTACDLQGRRSCCLETDPV